MSKEPDKAETVAEATPAPKGRRSASRGKTAPAGKKTAPRGKKTAPRGKKTPPRGKKTPSAGKKPGEPRADQVPIRLPSGEQAWVSADAFNLISEKEFRDSERLRRLRDQRNLAAAVAAVALIVFAAGAVSLLTRPAAPGAGDAGGSVGARPASPGPAEVAGSPDGRTESASPSPQVREIEDTVRAWAQAWSGRDAEAVLGFYSSSFLVPDGMGRATWEQLRRERITSPELLAVRVDDLAAEHTGPETAVARFLQVYDTPGYRAWVMKTLELANESGRWLIVDELASLAEVGTGSFEGEPELIQPAPVTNP